MASLAVREKLAVTVVAAARSGEGEPLPASAFVHLGALGRDAAAELVGPGRVDELYTRSRGHPLFLTELAQQAAGSSCPCRWSSRCPRAATSWARPGCRRAPPR